MGGDRFVVVGGGIVGLATGRELARRRPGVTITVLEKEAEVGLHQTSHNSGVVHAGLYYPPGSLKAELCARGRGLLRDYCAERDLPYVECGKLVVARDGSELERLAGIEARARANQVPELVRLDGAGLRDVEPNVAGVAGLHSPRTAITDFAAVARALARSEGVEVRTGCEVVGFAPGAVTVANGDRVPADRVVICAGLQSSNLAGAAGGRRAGAASGGTDGDTAGSALRTIPFRGEYWRLRPARTDLVRGLIYPVPDPRYPFLGVHFTRRVDGGVDLGPNAVLGLALEGYLRREVDPAWLARTLRWPGFWRMARANWRAGAHELIGSASKRVFVRRAATLVPGLTASDVERAAAGVRAQAVDSGGNLLDDFRVTRLGREGRIVAVQNAPSPAATSSMAIAEHICDHFLRLHH